MLNAIALHEVAGSNARLREALRYADLPTNDIEDEGRAFFEAVSGDGQTIGYAGLERCAGDYLLRSVVVLPAHRGHGVGRSVVEATRRRCRCLPSYDERCAVLFEHRLFRGAAGRSAGRGARDPPTVLHLPIVGDHHEAKQAADLTTDQDHD